MATTTKTWTWDSSTESWTLGSLTRDTANGSPTNGSIEHAGVAGRNTVTAYEATLTGVTWESLGVPSGATVNSIRISDVRTYAGLSIWTVEDAVTFDVDVQESATNLPVTGSQLWQRVASSQDGSWQTGSNTAAAVSGSYNSSTQGLRIWIQITTDNGNDKNAQGSGHLDYLNIEIDYTAYVPPSTVSPSSISSAESVSSPVSLAGNVNVGASAISAPAAGGSTYSQMVLADSPAHYYRLGEPSGTTANDAAGAIDGTYTNTPTLGATGLLTGDSDTAVTFPSGTWVQLTDDATFEPGTAFTLEFWVKRGTIQDDTNFYSKGTGGNFYGMANGTFRLGNDSGTVCTSTSTALSDTNPHHVVITYAGTGAGNTKIYIDGTEGHTDGPLIDTGLSANASNPRIGDHISGGEPCLATIDEVAVYNSVLTPAQIAAHYAAGLGQYAGTILNDVPVGYWRLGDTDTTAKAVVGSDGTYTGTYTQSETGATDAVDGDTAVTFSGATFGNYASGSMTTPTGALSIEFWAKVPNGAGGGYDGLLFGTPSAGWPGAWPCYETYAYPLLYMGGSNYRYFNPGTTDDGLWHHYVFTIAGSADADITNSHLYLDGVDVTTYGTTTSAGAQTARPDAWALGTAYNGGAQNGSTFDELAIYDYELTQAQAQAHYAASTPSSEPAIGTPILSQGSPPAADTITPTGIDSAETLGSAVLSPGGVVIAPSAIASAESIGTANLAPAGTGEYYQLEDGSGNYQLEDGSGNLLLETVPKLILALSIGSGENFGAPTLTIPATNLTITLTAVNSAEAVGSAIITPGTATIAVTGITSGEALGSLVLKATAKILSTAIASDESLGTAILLPGAVSIQVNAIDSGEVIGDSTVAVGSAPSQDVIVTAIDTDENVANPTLLPGGVTVTASSISSEEALGLPGLVASVGVLPTAIPSDEIVGDATVVALSVALPSGVASGEAFGTPQITTGGVVIAATEITPAEAVGSPILAQSGGPRFIAGVAIDSSEAVGTPGLQPGSVQIIAISIDTAEEVVSPAVIPPAGSIGPTSIDAAEALGTPVVASGQLVLAISAIDSQEVVGEPVLTTAVDIIASTILTGELLGSPIITIEDLSSIVIPEGIASLEGLGAPILETGNVFISVMGITSAEALGSTKLVGSLAHWNWVNPHGGFARTRPGKWPVMQNGFGRTHRDEGGGG